MKDYNDFFQDWDEVLEEQLRRLPVCDCCGDHIQDGYLYRFYGDIVCPGCVQDYIDNNFMEVIPEE